MSHDIVRTLSVGQAVEIQDACRRQNITLTELKMLTSGDNLRRSIAALNAAAPFKRSSLLSLKQTVGVSGADSFVAADHFKVDTSEKAKVKIAYLSTNFTTHFMSKREENVPAGELKVHTLLRSSVDRPIIDELGASYKTYLADLWALLEKQPIGEEGSLLADGWYNIFYLEDIDGHLWAVYAFWLAHDGGWHVFTYFVVIPDTWDAGNQVVSR